MRDNYNMTIGQGQKNFGSGHFRHHKDEIWHTFIKSLPRSTVILVFPVVLIIGALLYTRSIDMNVSSVYNYILLFPLPPKLIGSMSVLFFNVVGCLFPTLHFVLNREHFFLQPMKRHCRFAQSS